MNKNIYLFIAIISLTCLAIESSGADWTPDPNAIDIEQIKPVLKQLLDFICWPICLILYIASGIAALLLILTGARYVAADDPGTRSELRRYMISIIVGLMIVLIAIPVINFVIADLLPSVSCVCISGSIENLNTVFCNLITSLSTIGPWVCALVVVYGGLKYLASADDPGARKGAKTTLIAAFVGLVIIMLAIPLVNLVLGDALKAVACESSSNDFTEQIVSILCNFLYILALICPPICALVVTYGGLRYITSADDPGARDTAKTIIISALIGMILVMIAVPLVNVVVNSSTPVDYATKCTLQGAVTEEITRIMCNFICFLSYIAPAVCGLVVIYGGLRYLVSGDDPGARRTARTIIISAFVGLILVFIAVPMVNLVLTSFFGQVGCDCTESQSVKDIVNILCKFICFIASVSPAIAALVMILGGLRYVASAEDPGARSAAKTMIISAIVGLILVLISLAIVNLVVSGWAKDVQCGCFNVNPVEEINRVLCNLVCTVQMIIPSVAALVIIYGGMKYLTSAEDPGARAAARRIIINAIIGLFIVFLAVQIINFVISGLVPTFKCDCAKLFPEIFGQLGIAAGDSTNPGGSADPVLHVLSADAICTNCCQVGATECHYSYTSGGQAQQQDFTGGKITKCNPPAGSGTYSIEWQEPPPQGSTEGSLITMNPVADAKCSSGTPAPACTSAADAVAKGPTFVYDPVNGCRDKCAGQKCCLTTDQDGHQGCIGTDTPNKVKIFTCAGDVQSTYTCVSYECTPKEVICDQICQDGYTCASASPDPGNLDLANPEVI